ncbi:hypothetical protein NQ176_g7057 [Zarea fungicola]|uniref:Uncharacterized protein n=1 Tax=Zarea fungicola TaxID=93591 RepID=A0ACC1N0M4_9HYPO|nr:hypothetical protein NQ176_g7057 [Lecanicillium fungicola]
MPDLVPHPVKVISWQVPQSSRKESCSATLLSVASVGASSRRNGSGILPLLANSCFLPAHIGRTRSLPGRETGCMHAIDMMNVNYENPFSDDFVSDSDVTSSGSENDSLGSLGDFTVDVDTDASSLDEFVPNTDTESLVSMPGSEIRAQVDSVILQLIRLRDLLDEEDARASPTTESMHEK